MKSFIPDSMTDAVHSLMLGMGELAKEVSGIVDPLPFERSARAISACLKALHDVEEHNRQAAKHLNDIKYTRYEDLPPLSPEDQTRLKGELFELFNKVRIDNTSTPKLSSSPGSEP